MIKFFKYITTSPVQRVGLIVLTIGLSSLIAFSTHRNFDLDSVFDLDSMRRYHIFYTLYFYFIPFGLLMALGVFDFLFKWVKTGNFDIPKIKLTKKLITITSLCIFVPPVIFTGGNIVGDYYKKKQREEYCKIENCSVYAASEPVGVNAIESEYNYYLPSENLNEDSASFPLFEPAPMPQSVRSVTVTPIEQPSKLEIHQPPVEDILSNLKKENDLPPPRNKIASESIETDLDRSISLERDSLNEN